MVLLKNGVNVRVLCLVGVRKRGVAERFFAVFYAVGCRGVPLKNLCTLVGGAIYCM